MGDGMPAAKIDDMHEHVEERRRRTGTVRIVHDMRAVRLFHTAPQTSEHVETPLRLEKQGDRLGRERARSRCSQQTLYLDDIRLRTLQQQHVHPVGHMHGPGQEFYVRILVGEPIVRQVVVQDHVRIGAERRKLFEEQISVKRVLPHAFRFKRHHTVDFLRAIGAYIVQQRHEVRCAALRWIGHALRFQHGIEHRGHPQPVVDKSRIHAVESALHHNGYRDDGQAVIEPLWMRKSGPTRNRRSPCIGFAGLAQSSFAIWARALSICSWTSMPTMSSPSAATKRTSGMPNILAMPTMYS